MDTLLANLSDARRSTLEKYLPLIAIVAIAWLAARGLRKMLWTAFGLLCAVRWSGVLHVFW